MGAEGPRPHIRKCDLYKRVLKDGGREEEQLCNAQGNVGRPTRCAGFSDGCFVPELFKSGNIPRELIIFDTTQLDAEIAAKTGTSPPQPQPAISPPRRQIA